MTAETKPATGSWDASSAFGAGEGGNTPTATMALEQRLRESVAWYRSVRDGGTPDEVAAAAGQLDELYWPYLDKALVRACGGTAQGEAVFSEEEILLLNFGVIDAGLLPPRTAERLLEEYRQPGGDKVQYLTDHFSERIRVFREENAAAVPASDTSSEQYVGRLRETRLKVLKRLAPFIEGLPGVTPELAERFLTGRLDEDLLRINLTILDRPERPLLVHRRRLKALRESLLDKARRRTRTSADAQLFDLLQEVYVRDWRERFHATHGVAVVSRDDAADDSARDEPDDGVDEDLLQRVREEIARLRLAGWGVLIPGGESRSGPVLLDDAPRVTRAAILAVTGVAAALDRDGAPPAGGLILPFAGRGSMVWEDGVWLVGLRPTVSSEDSVATALGHYRALDDRHQHGGRLAGIYEKEFPGTEFERDFVADYRIFLTRSAKGDVKALSRERWAFFRDHIGPEIGKGPLIPANIRSVGPQTRALLATRVEKQIAATGGDALLCKRLAAIYWLDRRAGDAVKMLKEALRLNPDDAETALSLGLALEAAGQKEAADGVFRLGAERGTGTFWCIYCRDALGQLGG